MEDTHFYNPKLSRVYKKVEWINFNDVEGNPVVTASILFDTETSLYAVDARHETTHIFACSIPTHLFSNMDEAREFATTLMHRLLAVAAYYKTKENLPIVNHPLI